LITRAAGAAEPSMNSGVPYTRMQASGVAARHFAVTPPMHVLGLELRIKERDFGGQRRRVPTSSTPTIPTRHAPTTGS
jgi:hypothetical protein